MAGWRQAAIEKLEANSRVANTALGPVEYAEVGDPQAPAILAVHGRPGGYDQGLAMAAALGEDLARWIAISRPGYLRTPIKTGRTPAEQADAFAALLDALGIAQVVVVALSAGGPPSLQFALRHPDRCRGLVLISALSRRKLMSERTAGQKIYDWLISPSDQLSWLLFRAFWRLVTPASRAALSSALLLPATLRHEGRHNDLAQNAALPMAPPSGIDVPALIVHGTADTVVPMAHAEAAHRAIPGSRLVQIKNAGHVMIFIRPREIRPALTEFLASLPAAARSASG